MPSGLGLPLGAAKTSSDSESSEVAALYSESSESAKRFSVLERAIAIATAAALADLRVGSTISRGGASWPPPPL